MKTNNFRINSLAIMAAVLLLASVPGVSASGGFGSGGAAAVTNPTLLDMLTYAIQDEYAARAEYEMIIDEYGEIRPFTNIIRSEETHIGLLTPLFAQYGYPVPADTSSEHVILPSDLRSAFEIGVEAEIANIAMYEMFLARELPDDVRDVFERLMAASESHLRAFENGLNRYR